MLWNCPTDSYCLSIYPTIGMTSSELQSEIPVWRPHSSLTHGTDNTFSPSSVSPAQSQPESLWGPRTLRLLLARASYCHARLPAIQLWMSLSHGHLMASSSTSSKTAIILREWAGWVSPSIKLRYCQATPGLIGTLSGVCKGYAQQPRRGLLRRE